MEVNQEVDIMDYIYPKSQECPVCDREFMTFVVKKSKLRVLTRDTDLRTRYYYFDPYPYDVIMCTFCGYAAMSSYFERITDKQGAMIREKIMAQFTPREYHIPLSSEDALERYKMTLLCAVTMNAKLSVRALVCLRIAWLYRDMEDDANETQYLRRALIGLKEAYGSETFPMAGMDEFTAQLTIAELSRRTGDVNEAMRWVSTLVTSRGVPSAIKDRATDIKELIREGSGHHA